MLSTPRRPLSGDVWSDADQGSMGDTPEAFRELRRRARLCGVLTRVHGQTCSQKTEKSKNV